MTKDKLYSCIQSPGTKIMGILNITPDSFYDGGRYVDPEVAVERGRRMMGEGADIIDVGAESTKPGSEGILPEEEISRLTPVLSGLREISKIPISLDTSKPKVARFFLKKEMVNMINDVTGLRNPEMVRVVKEFDIPVVIMHMYGTPRDMQQIYKYDDVVSDIVEFFRMRIEESQLSKIVIDPGIGFGKSLENNLEIIKRLSEFKSLEFPVMIGISRKSFIGGILNLDACERLEGSLGSLAISVMNGVNIVRVHDVKESIRVIKVVEAIKNVAYKEIQV